MSSVDPPYYGVQQEEDQADIGTSVDVPEKPAEKPENVFVQPAPPPDVIVKEKMAQEEMKFKSKYPNMRPGGVSALLAKRLQKQKYFDSGDYNMAKAKINNPKQPLPAQEKMMLQETLGDAIPTPESLPPRKTSLVQSKLAEGTLS